MQKDIFI